MAKSAERIDRAIEFWLNRRGNRFLLSQPTIDLLKDATSKIGSTDVLTLQHVEVLNLAVSLFEAQMRDCLRLAVDSDFDSLDHKSDFLDIKIDSNFLAHMQKRRFTLGEFVFVNTSITTVERLWSAMAFCFKEVDEQSYLHFLDKTGRTEHTYQEMKASLAWIYYERNRYVHEFFDDTAALLETAPSHQFNLHLQHAHDFLTYVQDLKNDHFNWEYPEDHPRLGEFGRELNASQRAIDELTKKIYAFIRTLPTDHPNDIYVDALRETVTNFLAVADEFAHVSAQFAYTTYGPSGTIRRDFANGALAEELERTQRKLADAYDSMQSYSSELSS